MSEPNTFQSINWFYTVLFLFFIFFRFTIVFCSRKCLLRERTIYSNIAMFYIFQYCNVLKGNISVENGFNQGRKLKALDQRPLNQTNVVWLEVGKALLVLDCVKACFLIYLYQTYPWANQLLIKTGHLGIWVPLLPIHIWYLKSQILLMIIHPCSYLTTSFCPYLIHRGFTNSIKEIQIPV